MGSIHHHHGTPQCLPALVPMPPRPTDRQIEVLAVVDKLSFRRNAEGEQLCPPTKRQIAQWLDKDRPGLRDQVAGDLQALADLGEIARLDWSNARLWQITLKGKFWVRDRPVKPKPTDRDRLRVAEEALKLASAVLAEQVDVTAIADPCARARAVSAFDAVRCAIAKATEA